MVCWFDRSVGRIDEALERLGLRENTLLIVTSDNGSSSYNINDAKVYAILRENPEMSAQEMIEQGLINPSYRVSGPYRGYKTDIWDGSTHVPFIARWPGHIAPGSVSHGEFCLMDMLPTMAALFQTTVDKVNSMDGISRPNILLGREGDAPREELMTHSYTGAFALRKGPWKLIPDIPASAGHGGPYRRPEATQGKASVHPGAKLRAAFATMAGKAGAPDRLLKAYLGHSSGDILGGHYRKINLDELRTVSGAMDAWRSSIGAADSGNNLATLQSSAM